MTWPPSSMFFGIGAGFPEMLGEGRDLAGAPWADDRIAARCRDGRFSWVPGWAGRHDEACPPRVSKLDTITHEAAGPRKFAKRRRRGQSGQAAAPASSVMNARRL